MELADQSEPRAAAAVLLLSRSFFLLSHMHKQGSGLARIISRPAPASGAFFFSDYSLRPQHPSLSITFSIPTLPSNPFHARSRN